MAWTTEKQPFGDNHAPLLTGVSSINGHTPVPVAVDPTTGALLTSGGGGGGSATVVGIGPLGQNNIAYDSLTYTATSPTVDTYQYYQGGVLGTLTATLTITFTDASHATLVSAVRT